MVIKLPFMAINCMCPPPPILSQNDSVNRAIDSPTPATLRRRYGLQRALDACAAQGRAAKAEPPSQWFMVSASILGTFRIGHHQATQGYFQDLPKNKPRELAKCDLGSAKRRNSHATYDHLLFLTLHRVFIFYNSWNNDNRSVNCCDQLIDCSWLVVHGSRLMRGLALPGWPWAMSHESFKIHSELIYASNNY